MTKRIVVVIDMDDRDLKGKPFMGCDPESVTHRRDEPLSVCIVIRENGELIPCDTLTISPSSHKRSVSREEQLYKKVIQRR